MVIRHFPLALASGRVSRVTSSLFAQLLLFNLFTFNRNTWYKMQKAAIYVHGQNDSSSILDGTSFTSDTQPAVPFFFILFF